jgi:glycosyltransferase involved in cell wall biosynthesis
MHLLQVCNVGNVCGGTAACVWTITRALPGCRHAVLFLTPPTSETRRAFAHCRIESQRRVTQEFVARLAPDAVILHNTLPDRSPRLRGTVSIQYRHSTGERVEADLEVACSRFLAEQLRRDIPVLYQGVPLPPRRDGKEDKRHFDDELVIGRICTPIHRKWPDSLIPFYRELHRRFPEAGWEFVGAPEGLQSELADACGGRVRFHQAHWQARSHLQRWHVLLYHHPNLTETFGRTVAEAMRAGCVPVVDDRGGFREQITSGTNGFLARSADEFAQAIAAIHDPSFRWLLSRQARTSAEARFSLPTFAARLKQVLHEAARTQPG